MVQTKFRRRESECSNRPKESATGVLRRSAWRRDGRHGSLQQSTVQLATPMSLQSRSPNVVPFVTLLSALVCLEQGHV